jgi:predicted DNA-binding transcriptional regulator AlpA
MRPNRKQRLQSPAELPGDDLALMREWAVLKVYPVSPSEWWKGIREGRYPKPVRIGKRIDAWRAGDVRRLLIAAEPVR